MTGRDLDPQVAAGLRAVMAATASRPAPSGTGELRALLDEAMSSYPLAPEHPVPTEDLVVAGGLPARLYRPATERYSALVVYLHGGGRIAGSLDTHHGCCGALAEDASALVLSVGYRLAPDHRVPAQEDDAVAALAWADSHRAELGAEGLPLVVAGDSAGGGIAAGAALRVRETGPELALQLLLYPSLDERAEPPSDRAVVRLMTWTPGVNALAWRLALGDDPAAGSGLAGRAEDLAGLPRTYLEVGELDLFLPSVLEYASRLAAAGVPLELHVHPGMPHAGEAIAPDADRSRLVRAGRAAALRALA